MKLLERIKNPLEGLNTYRLGNSSLGLQLVLRNLNITNKRHFPRRYIRLIIRILGYSLQFEFRFSNSI